MADIMDGSIAVEVGKAEAVDLEVIKASEDDSDSVTKGLKRKLEESEEPKLNGNAEEKNGHAVTEEKAEKNGHKNGNSVDEQVKDSPVKKAKTDEEEVTKIEEKTEIPSVEEKTEVTAEDSKPTEVPAAKEDSKPVEETKAAEPAATEEIEAVTETKEMEVEETKEAEGEKEKVEAEPAVVVAVAVDAEKVEEAEAGEPAEEKASE